MALLNRILVHTPNSIGLGHLFRTSAVITGIRHWRPRLDFLVLTGSSLPQVLLKDGIEVIKLPGVRQELGHGSHPPATCRYRPRYLSGMEIENLMALRTKIIEDAFDYFKPDVVILEHKLAGLMDEASVLLEKKAAASGRADEFTLVHLSRGITGRSELSRFLDLDSGRYDIMDLYDHLFILEDEAAAPAWRTLKETAEGMKEKISFLGRTTIKTKTELPPRRDVLTRLGLDDRPIILASLGRHGDIGRIFENILNACAETGLLRTNQLVFVEDPYLDSVTKSRLASLGKAQNVVMLPFIFNLVDLINISDLVICRAGYNMVNEIQMTCAKALVIPEQHPSGEQELRAAGLQARDLPTDEIQSNIKVMYERDVVNGDLARIILNVLTQKNVDNQYDFNKYDIGRRIVEDLERRVFCR